MGLQALACWDCGFKYPQQSSAGFRIEKRTLNLQNAMQYILWIGNEFHQLRIE
jgi:hypothetical protein